MVEQKRAHAKVRVTRAEEAHAERVFVQGEGLEDLSEVELMSLQRKFRCKRDIYSYLDQRGKCSFALDMRPSPSVASPLMSLLPVGVFLPPYEWCSKIFLGQLLTGKRKWVFRKDVPRLSAPKWPELALADIWPQIQEDRELLLYFPERATINAKLPNRDFFWGILQTLRQNYCEDLIAEAQDRRSAVKSRVPNANTILNIGVTKEMAQLLLRDTFNSRKSAFVVATVDQLSLLPSAVDCIRVSQQFGVVSLVYNDHVFTVDG